MARASYRCSGAGRHIEDMGFFGPDMIVFYGKNDNGEAVQLIQHTSRLSVLLVGVRKQAERPRRIGFLLDEKEGAAPTAAPSLSKYN